jgi:hypothetical protein
MVDEPSCPVCRSESLQRVLRGAIFSAELGGEINPLRGITSYRCSQGHLFMILATATVAPQRVCDSPIFLLNIVPHR